MKGFPNQISDLEKLANAMAVLIQLVDAGQNARDDGVYGEALARAGVIGSRDSSLPIETYIAQQRSRPLSSSTGSTGI